MIRRHLGRIAMFLMLVAGGLAMSNGALLAQQQQQPPASQQNEFVPVKELPPAQTEHIPAAPLVMAAYAFVWVALLVYVWSVWRRVGAVQRELGDLRRRTERKA